MSDYEVDRSSQVYRLAKLLEYQVNGVISLPQAEAAWRRALASQPPDIVAEAIATGMVSFELSPGRIGIDAIPPSKRRK